jgi:hypothetical protein
MQSFESQIALPSPPPLVAVLAPNGRNFCD